MRPFVFINAAMSADGKISTKERKQIKISSSEDFERVDDLKAGSDAIIVGIGTVLSDNPSLTVKSKENQKKRKKGGKDSNPIRIIVDSSARTPEDSDLLHKGAGKRMIFVSGLAPKERIDILKNYAEIIVMGKEKVDLKKMLYELKTRGVDRVMVEGGATLNWTLISMGLVDEIYTFVGNLVIGGKDAPTLVDGEGFEMKDNICRLELIGSQNIGDGIVLRWLVKN